MSEGKVPYSFGRYFIGPHARYIFANINADRLIIRYSITLTKPDLRNVENFADSDELRDPDLNPKEQAGFWV